MIVLTEYNRRVHPITPSVLDLRMHTETARTLGCPVYELLPDERDEDGNRLGTPEEICQAAPSFSGATALPPVLAAWIGFIPTEDRYEMLAQKASERNIRLLNTPDQHFRAMQLHLAYPFIKPFTPATAFITGVDGLDRAVSEVGGYPIFIKGDVQSMKSFGPAMCFANTAEVAKDIIKVLAKRKARTLGTIAIRAKADLRHSRESTNGFPLGREYRVFLYNHKVLSLGYYWDADDPLKELSGSERSEVIDLATRVSKSMAVPYICVDVGQLSDGSWCCIETGDPQVAGLSQNKPLELWSALKDAVDGTDE